MRSITINSEQAKFIAESIERDEMKGKLSKKLLNDVHDDNTPISSLPIPASLSKKIVWGYLIDGYKKAVENFSDDITSISLDKVCNKLNKLIAICKKKEEEHRYDLEKLCADVAVSYFQSNELRNLKLECRLVNDLTSNEFHIEPNTGDAVFSNIDEYRNTESIVASRKLCNVLSMGGALSLYDKLQERFIYALFEIDEELPHLYSKILKINEYLMYVSEYEITDQTNHQSGYVEVKLGGDNEIIATGTLFPFLLVETFRGYLELLSDKMLPDNKADGETIMEKADVLKDEPWYMIIGPQLWDKIVGDDASAADIIEELYNLDNVEFNNFISEVLVGTEDGEEKVKELLDKVGYNRDYSDFEKSLGQKRRQHSLIYNNMFAESEGKKEANLNEIIDEATYPESFNMDEFKSLKSYNARVKYCKEKLKYVGKGTSRIVFMIDNNTVLKLAYNEKGVAQNEADARPKNDYYLKGFDMFPEVYDVDDDYLWIEMAYAKRATQKDFKRLTGFSFQTFYYWITECWNNSVAPAQYVRYIPEQYKMLFNSNKFKDVYDYSIFMELEDYISNYQVEGIGDLQRITSWGVEKDRDGGERLVLIDNGLSNDVLDKYYR